MRVLVLGSAAGGGFPQWNAASEACMRARSGDPAARPATQCSIAVTADGERWLLVNASPDLRQQIEANPQLHPKVAPRSSPIAAIVLTNADVDAVAGLLHLREGTPFALYGGERTLAVLDRNPIFDVLDRRIVPRRNLPVDSWFEPEDAAGRPLGLRLRAFAVPGKPPLWLEGEIGGDLVTDAEEGDVLGLEIVEGDRRLVWLGNCARITPALRERIRGCDLLFLDGTLWRDDEMILAGVGTKTGRRMGHISMSGPDGAIAAVEDLPVGRRLFVHVNNTNPALLADSPERAELERRGFEVAADGMEIRL
jgi:pyrroloquinoline quinone biosynthesis protein B